MKGGFALSESGQAAAVPGDPADFAAWVSPHLSVLYALAVREVGARDADDVVQESLVRAWRRRSTFRPHRGSARAWLVGVLLDQARRYRVRHRVRVAAPSDGPGDVDGEHVRATRLDVERAVRTLPRRQREVIVLHYLADLSVDEVAQLLGISAGSVKSHLFDARVALRGRWEPK